ncbi:helix-turn-helix domain-containing protein [Shewanella sp. SM101]|uniref:helix-turn-helix domain-containing protein n=1 Tax=Shewanella sp. SM101 TaxID=2912789 RepID=UPI0021DAD058|nr:helix-turn-helix transcriptional regulator [Shewanella sp. SM101]MCU8103487.1 helix-turn-helix domain-containing protein [Shewanella sp. SM101]
MRKKSSRTSSDWHRQDILAEVRKTCGSLTHLARESGLASSTLYNALDRKWPKGELIIATAIGVTPNEIWPSRYVEEFSTSTNNDALQREVA